MIAEKGSIIQNYGDVPSCNVPRALENPGLKWYKGETGQWTVSGIPSPAGHGARIAGLAGPLAEFFHGRRPPIATAEDGRDTLRMIRAQILEQLASQGARAKSANGPFGPEIFAEIPVTAEGKQGMRLARFIGVDGPRWFLRGVISGRAAVDPEKARELEAVFGDVVVVRGNRPHVPRDLLPLTLPGQARPEAAAGAPAAADAFDPLRRGPEITEVH